MTKLGDEDVLEVAGEEEENEVAVVYDIATYPSDLTLSGIVDLNKTNDIIIPDFQRNFVWTIKKSSLLIESFLLGLPVPQVFFYIDDENRNLVIDGQQRILSIVYYFDGYFGSENIHGKRQVFRLKGLDEKSPYFNKKFVELDEKSQRKLKASVLRAMNVRQLSPSDDSTSIYHIFERLNTGGVALTSQEIRNCVFRGQFVKILRKLNNEKAWRSIIGKKTFDKHQKDVELILRIFSLSHGAWKTYEKPMKEFLNKSMKRHNKGSTDEVKRFQMRFKKAAVLIVDTLGEKPFHVRGPLNASIMDSVFCTILSSLSKIPDDLAKRYQKLLADKEFTDSTYYGTSDVTVLGKRFTRARKILLDLD